MKLSSERIGEIRAEMNLGSSWVCYETRNTDFPVYGTLLVFKNLDYPDSPVEVVIPGTPDGE